MAVQFVFAAELAPHLARALELYARWAREAGVEVPDGFVDGLMWARTVARGLVSPEALPPVDDVGVEPLLLTFGDTAGLLGCSVSSVKKLVASGQLRTVTFGKVRRVRRADVDEFVAGLDGTSPSFRESAASAAAVVLPRSPSTRVATAMSHGAGSAVRLREGGVA